MTVLIDTNIFMDLLEKRQGVETSTDALTLIIKNKIPAQISALTPPILWFLMEKKMSEIEAARIVKEVIEGFFIVSLTPAIINKAFNSNITDFEDAIQLHSALKGKCEYLITRNKRDFISKDGITILTPEEFLARQT